MSWPQPFRFTLVLVRPIRSSALSVPKGGVDPAPDARRILLSPLAQSQSGPGYSCFAAMSGTRPVH